jgi:glyoxylase-like metal-dependent hydrolase (beta-lactamase superfamily II)
MQIVPNVHVLAGVIVNCYLVEDQDGLMLIDTGLPHNAGTILAYIRKIGKDPAQLHTIVITHADGDHFGSLADLQAALPNVQTYANPIEAEAIRKGESSRPLSRRGIEGAAFKLISPLFKSTPARIDHEFGGGDRFSSLGFLNVLATPGHTPGHISLFSPSTGILFSGDSIAVRGKKLGPSDPSKTWNMDLARKSYEMEISLHPSWILGGHGRIEITSTPDLHY